MAYKVTLQGQTHDVNVIQLDNGLLRVTIDGVDSLVDSKQVNARLYSLLWDKQSILVDVSADGEEFIVSYSGKNHKLHVIDERRARRSNEASGVAPAQDKELRSIMPGKVVQLLVAEGDAVEKDQGIIIIEAMKMENEIRATAEGVVKTVHVTAGQAVESGELLVELD